MTGYLPDNDYSQDSLRWGQLLRDKQLKTNPSHEDLDKLQDDIIKEADSALAYFFAERFLYKSFRMQKVILDKKVAKYAFMFAQHIPNADIKALQNIVVESKKIKYITHFACFVKSADHELLKDLIIDSGKVKYAHMYLKHVKGANVNDFKEVIINSGKPRYLFELAKHFDNPEDITRIEGCIIASGSFTYMRLFAEKIKLANVEKIEQVVLDSNNSEEMQRFARYVRRSRMKRFLLVV